ncbi:MAG: SDR family oxidoreductase [Gemmatimonadota bacterium]
MTSQQTNVAVITGAGTGIGKAVALGLLSNGYRVVFAGIYLDSLQQAVSEAGDHGPNATAIQTDVSNPDSVASLFRATVDRHGRVDVLLNNAGVVEPAVNLEDLSDEQWRSVIDVNLTGAFFCTREAFRVMKSQNPRGGRIINIGSISAHSPRPNQTAYTASKHGITGLTKSTSLEGRKYDIACGQIDIGNAATELGARVSKGVPQANGQIAVEPLLQVSHIVNAVLYIASLPLDANVQFLALMPSKMPFLGRG